jgi:hypothetical protein
LADKNPRVVLSRYKSPAVAAVDGGDSDRVERRKKRKRRPVEVPRWLALVPALFFACAGVVLIGGGVLKAGLMVYYNLTAGEVVRFGADRRLWGQLALTSENFLHVLWAIVSGIGALVACWSWMWDESRRAVKLTVAVVAFFCVSPWLMKSLTGDRRLQPAVAARPIGRPEGPAGQAPFPAAPGGGNAGARPEVGVSQAPVVTIWLDRMTEAERSKNEAVLKREFASLRHYVPDTVRIEGTTLVWRATILVQNMEQHKLEAIAILRRNNIRLSDFSERWLKGRESGAIGPPGFPGR